MIGEYWLRDVLQLEQSVLASGGGPPIADAYTINGHPGPNYNCSGNGKHNSISTILGEILIKKLYSVKYLMCNTRYLCIHAFI